MPGLQTHWPRTKRGPPYQLPGYWEGSQAVRPPRCSGTKQNTTSECSGNSYSDRTFVGRMSVRRQKQAREGTAWPQSTVPASAAGRSTPACVCSSGPRWDPAAASCFVAFMKSCPCRVLQGSTSAWLGGRWAAGSWHPARRGIYTNSRFCAVAFPMATFQGAGRTPASM